MKYLWILKIIMLLQCIVASQHSVVHEAKRHIRAEVRSALGSPAGSSTLVVHRHAAPPHPPSRPLYRTQHHYHHHRKHHDHPRHKDRHPTTHRLHHRWTSNADRGYLGGGRSHSPHHHHHHHHHSEHQSRYSGWSEWSECGGHDCVKRRERLCRVKRKCGHTKQVEERKCWSCEPSPSTFIDHHEPSFGEPPTPVAATAAPLLPVQPSLPQSIIINAAAAAAVVPTEAPHHQPTPPVTPPPFGHRTNSSLYGSDELEGSDFFVLNTRPKWKALQQPDYDDGEDTDNSNNNNYESAKQYIYMRSAGSHGNIKPLRNSRHAARPHQRKSLRQAAPTHADDGVEGDIFQYEDFDFDVEGRASFESQYNDSYEDDEFGGRNSSSLVAKERATPDALLPRHKRVYSKWSRWTKCSPKCTTRRYKKCRVKEQCGREVLREIAYCYTEGSFCQQWLQAQMQKNPPYELKPVAAARRREISYGGGNSVGGNAIAGGGQANAIVSDYIMNGKGYRGPEYTPMKLKCGIAGIRNGKRNMYNMLKIIGGKPARKGEWPWQVAIINRFKEAFCGGTLIAPQWVLTAAHCVRKLLYVRVGEHNLDYEDGTELQMRVLKSFKHPNFDKKTVDSDVALLRLPKAVNATSWIGFSCLPRPYQPLPKNVECTVIGWGKRRNRDIAGTSVLHQAEVPIIPMDNCRSVYQDYTITKNMFCAGHKRRRIDTCAGDSGGPLLCRDSTKPNHPWTIFGITSFGDGCAKRNKFGIYAKVPNYVDWVWSVINCNGNCKLHQRAYE